MSNDWRKKYQLLKDFIANNKSIIIERNRTLIPSELKQGYSKLFDNVKIALIGQYFSVPLDDANFLAAHYLSTRKSIIDFVGLENVSTTKDLDNFLMNPEDSITRILNNPLLGLLKGNLNIESFTREVISSIKSDFKKFYELGYERWIILSVMKLLSPNDVLKVSLPQPSSHELVKYTPTTKKPAPVAYKSKSLTLVNEQFPVNTVPDFIIHSAGINKYIAFKSNFTKPLWVVDYYRDEREWYSINSVDTALSPDLTLLYLDSKLDNISLIADAEKVCRPDLVIKCKIQKDWYEKEGLEKVKLQHDSLKPKLGTYIITKELLQEQIMAEQPDGINILTVGFDQSKLEPIISALMQTKDKD